MPRILLLVVLFLLLGGYLFLRSAGVQEERLPQVELRAVISPAEGKYVVGAEGRLFLPGEKEYNVVGSVYVTSEGKKVKEAQISTISRGPSTLPLSVAGVPVEPGDVRVGADLIVGDGSRVMPVKVELPVVFPPPSALLQPPAVGVGLSSIEYVEGGREAILTVFLSNPNSFPVDVRELSIVVGDKTYPLSGGSLPDGESIQEEVPVEVESNSLSVKVKGKVEAMGASRSFEEDFRLNLPSLPDPFPYYTLEVKSLTVSESGVGLDVNVSLRNPSSVPLSLKNLLLVIEKGDFSQRKEVAKELSLAPGEEKSYGVKFNSVPFLVGGNLYLEVNGRRVASVPVDVISQDLLKPPEVNMWVEDVNGGGVVHIALRNPNEFNIDIMGLDVEVLVDGVDVAGYSPTNIVLQESREITLGSSTSPLPVAPGHTWVRVVYEYGLRSLGLLSQERISFLYT